MMETCNYEAIETTLDNKDRDSTISKKYLLRQVLVCSGIWLSYFCAGLSFGSPTVFIPQIRREANSSDAVSIVMASWLSSTLNYSGIVGCVILAAFARLIGRKVSFLMTCISALLGYIILYYSTTLTQILISQIVQGLLTACPITISMMVLTEYISPRYRGVFLTLKSATFMWGIWAANAIGTYLHWKNIAILGFTCSTYSLLTCLFWPESPYLLAMKNRFEDCAASHRWLKGCSRESESELKILIQSRKNVPAKSGKSTNFFKKIIKMFTTKLFYKPILLSMLVMSLYHFSGKLPCAMYALDIIMRITGTESTAYTGMLILDGITVFGMYVGCGLAKIFKRRTLLLISSAIAVTFLFCISLYLYLIYFEIILEHTITSMSLLIGYSVTVSVGPMIMATTILGELIPVKHRSSSILILGGYANFLMGVIMKISPFVLNYFGARGLFLFFSMSLLTFTIISYKVLPETKDKTILEIQENLLCKETNIKSVGPLKQADELARINQDSI